MLRKPSQIYFILIILLFLVILLAACALPLPEVQPQQPAVTTSNPAQEETSVSPTLPASTLTPVSSMQETAVPSPAVSQQAPQNAPIHYILSVQFDYGYQNLSVFETVDYQNRTGESLPSIKLTIEPARVPGVFTMNAVTWADGSAANYILDGRVMELLLLRPLETGETISFSINYELSLPLITDPETENDRPFAFGYTRRQSNLVDWYPMVPPYQPGTGWLIHNPWYFGEHVVYEESDFDVTIKTQDAPASLVIAASAPAEEVEGGFTYHLENARSFAWSAGAEYQVLSQQVGDITINSYFFPFDPAAGQQALIDTADAVELYTRLYGSYPHKTLAVVEADFLDGMEYEGLYFLSRGFYNLYEGTPNSYLTAIAVHETAHQWWYGKVSDDQALEPWLDEAFCAYSEYLFYENTYPDLKDWWWSFRVDYYSPKGMIDGRIYDYNGFRPYVNAVYLQGAHFLHDLRKTMGDDAFFAFLKAYAQANTGKIVTKSDFFNLLSQYSDQDLSSLLSVYFQSP